MTPANGVGRLNMKVRAYCDPWDLRTRPRSGFVCARLTDGDSPCQDCCWTSWDGTAGIVAGVDGAWSVVELLEASISKSSTDVSVLGEGTSVNVTNQQKMKVTLSPLERNICGNNNTIPYRMRRERSGERALPHRQWKHLEQ
ncbi:hypothetical protein Aduo_012451 [Ancylostoma duodenale]